MRDAAPLLDLDDLAVVAEDDGDDALVAAPAQAVIGRLPDFDPLDEAVEDRPLWRLLLEEGVASALKAGLTKFVERKHPRWPAGTPGGKGGQFMETGQRFLYKGREFEIKHVVKGKIYAQESSGKYADAQLIELTPDKDAAGGLRVKDVTVAPPRKIKGGKSSTQITVVSPYVEPETHNPLIAIPEGSKISAEEWKAFGEVDQRVYADRMERFGPWKAGAAQKLITSIYEGYSHEIQGLVRAAYNSQYGSSSGDTLSLTTIFDSYGTEEKHQKKYEQARALMSELGEVLQWDLYNRTRSPDVAIFHKGNTSPSEYKSTYIDGDKAIMSAYSQSFKFSANNQFGSNTIATPIAIHHIVMSSYSAYTVGKQFQGEYEVAVAERLKLDDRSIAFKTSDMGFGEATIGHQARSWLEGVTDKPAPGPVIGMLKDAWAGKGTLPLPPIPAGLTKIGNKTEQHYEELPPEVGAAAGKLGLAAGYFGGDQEGAKQLAQEMGLVPGDFMEGMKGTRYVIIADPGDTYGLRYVKLDPSTGKPNYAKSYPLSASYTNPFYKLDAHIDVPKPKAKEGFTPFSDEQYAQLVNTEEKPIHEFKAGEIFKVEGVAYQIDTPSPTQSDKATVLNLDTGEKWKVNPGFKTVLQAKGAGFIEPGDAAPDGGSLMGAEPYAPKVGELLVATKNGQQFLAHYAGVSEAEDALPGDIEVRPAGGGATQLVNTSDISPLKTLLPDKPEAGDIFAHEGKRWTVTTIRKDGAVRAKPAGGGPVQSFAPPGIDNIVGLPTITSALFRPGDYAVGPKAKAGTLAVGDMISGSPAKVRPLVVVQRIGGKVRLLDLETGKFVESSKNKSWPLLVGKPDPQADLPDEQPAMTPVPLLDLAVGQHFSLVGKHYEILTVAGDGSGTAKHLLTGKILSWTPEEGTYNVLPLTAKSSLPVELPPTAAKPNYEAMKPGDEALLSALKEGDQFIDLEWPDQLMQVVTPAQGDQDAHVAAVSAGGVVDSVGGALGPGTQVKLHLKAAFVPDYSKNVGTNADDLTMASGNELKPFAQGKVYKKGVGVISTHAKLSTLPTGAKFVDKGGTAWLVKEGGANPIISNGQENFSGIAFADSWVKPESEVKGGIAFADQSPPLGNSGMGANEKLAFDMLVDVPAGKSLGDFYLKPMDTFFFDGQVWAVTAKAGPGGVTAYSLKDGKSQIFLGHAAIEKVLPGKEQPGPAEGPVAGVSTGDWVQLKSGIYGYVKLVDELGYAKVYTDPEGGSWMASLDLGDPDEVPTVVPAATLSTLKVGDQFLYPATGLKYEVTTAPDEQGVFAKLWGSDDPLGQLWKDAEQVTVIKTGEAAPKPAPAPAGPAVGYEVGDKVLPKDMVPGTQFVAGSQEAPFVVLANDGFKLTYQKADEVGTIAPPTVWDYATHGSTTAFEVVALPRGPSVPGPSAGPAPGDQVTSSEMLDDLPVGSKIKHSTTGKGYVKLPDGVWKWDDGDAGALTFPSGSFPTSGKMDVYVVDRVGPADPAGLPSVEQIEKDLLAQDHGDGLMVGSNVAVMKVVGINDVPAWKVEVQGAEEPVYYFDAGNAALAALAAAEGAAPDAPAAGEKVIPTQHPIDGVSGTWPLYKDIPVGAQFTTESGKNITVISKSGTGDEALVIARDDDTGEEKEITGWMATTSKWVFKGYADDPPTEPEVITATELSVGDEFWISSDTTFRLVAMPTADEPAKLLVLSSEYSGGAQPGEEVTWGGPGTLPNVTVHRFGKATAPDAEPATAPPMSTSAAKAIGFYKPDGPKVPKSELGNFQLIQLPNGDIAYHRNVGGLRKIWALGKNQPSKTTAKSFTPVVWRGPALAGAELEDAGDVSLQDLPVGAAFSFAGKDIQIIGKTEEGIAGWFLNGDAKGQIAFSQQNPTVTRRVPVAAPLLDLDDFDGPGPYAEMPALFLKPGDTFTFGAGGLNEYVVMGDSDIAGGVLRAKNPATGNVWEGDPATVGTVYDVKRVQMVAEPKPVASADPDVWLRHLPVGTYFRKPGATEDSIVLKHNPDSIAVEDPDDGYVLMSKDTVLKASQVRTQFDELSVGAHLKDDFGNVWKKVDAGSAQLVFKRDPKQLADVGEVLSGWTTYALVFAVPPDAAPAAPDAGEIAAAAGFEVGDKISKGPNNLVYTVQPMKEGFEEYVYVVDHTGLEGALNAADLAQMKRLPPPPDFEPTPKGLVLGPDAEKARVVLVKKSAGKVSVTDDPLATVRIEYPDGNATTVWAGDVQQYHHPVLDVPLYGNGAMARTRLSKYIARAKTGLPEDEQHVRAQLKEMTAVQLAAVDAHRVFVTTAKMSEANAKVKLATWISDEIYARTAEPPPPPPSGQIANTLGVMLKELPNGAPFTHDGKAYTTGGNDGFVIQVIDEDGNEDVWSADVVPDTTPDPLGAPGDAPASEWLDSDQLAALSAGTVIVNPQGKLWTKKGEGKNAPYESVATGDVEHGPSGQWKVFASPDLPAVGSFVTLKPGTMYGQGADEKFEVVNVDTAGKTPAVHLDNNQGGTIAVNPDMVTSVTPAEFMNLVPGQTIAPLTLHDLPIGARFHNEAASNVVYEVVGHDDGFTQFRAVEGPSGASTTVTWSTKSLAIDDVTQPEMVTLVSLPPAPAPAPAPAKALAPDADPWAADPSAWQPGDTIQRTTGEQATVVTPLPPGETVGYLGLKHPNGSPFSLHTSALVDTYGYKRIAKASEPLPEGGTTPFKNVAFGHYFKDGHGNIWQKGGGGKAKLALKRDPMQLATVGEVVPGFEGEQVTPMDASAAHAEIAAGPEAVWEQKLANVKPGDTVWKPDPETGEGLYPSVVASVTKNMAGQTTAFFIEGEGTYDKDDKYVVFDKPEVQSSGPLDPYKWPKIYKKGVGVTATHDKLGSLAIGQRFSDKAKNEYEVVGHSGNSTIYRDDAGDQYLAPSNAWVRAIPVAQSPEAEQDFSDLPFGSITGFPSSWSSSGEWLYPELGDMIVGSIVLDAAGDEYVVIGKASADGVVYLRNLATGAKVAVDPGYHVKPA